VVVSAPSGAGKTTLCQNLMAAHRGLGRAVTCTTRAPRAGERDGVDYYFLTPVAFERQVESGAFLEHATVHGAQYGTLKSEVVARLRAGEDVLLNIDVQGAAAVRSQAEADPLLRRALVTVFYTPMRFADLAERLRGRATDAELTIQRRLDTANNEVARWKEFDYLVCSTTREEDVRRLLAILEAERQRTTRIREFNLG
jgi:guanylate kinase